MSLDSGVVVDPDHGLTTAEVAERIATGRSNAVQNRNSRSLGDIVRANTFTYFNALIGGLWVLMLVSAPLIDSLFGLVIVVNTGDRHRAGVPRRADPREALAGRPGAVRRTP